MSGSNDPNQGGQQPNRGGPSRQNTGANHGGQQPNQSGQSRQSTGQSQGRGAAQQAPRSQQRRQPPGGGGNALDALGEGEPNKYLKGIISTMATVGILLGVLVFLLGAIGGFAVLPGAYDDARQEIEQQASDTGVPGSSQVSADYIDKVESSTYKTLNGYLVSLIAPFIAFLMAPIFGIAVAFQMDDGSKVQTVAAGTFVGAILFMILATFIASLSIPDATAFLPDGLGELATAQMDVSTALGSVQFLTLLIDSVVVGTVTAAAAAATTFSIDNFVSA